MENVRVEYMALSELLERQHPRNPKDHAIDSIVNSISRFGFVTPGTIDERTERLAEGHGRAKALAWMKRQGREAPARIEDREDDWYVPVYRGVSFNSDAELEAFLVAANRLTILGGWNEPELAALLQDLAAQDTALLEATGYDGDDLQALLDELTPPEPAADPGAQIDRAEELQAEWQVERGQVWVIPSKAGKGAHRLMCGDSTNVDDVARLMGGECSDMVFTDPPYALFGNSTGVSGITDDKMVMPFFRELLKAAKAHTKEFGHIYICSDWHSAFALERASRDVGLSPKNLCVWDKGDGGVGAMYQQCYEFVWFFANSPRSNTLGGKRAGERTVNGVSNIWRVGRMSSDREHGAQKPVDLVIIPLRNGCDKDEIVLDLFTGSGTTLVDCEQTGRIGYGMEIEPKYCAVTLQRLSDMGLTPRRVDADGTP